MTDQSKAPDTIYAAPDKEHGWLHGYCSDALICGKNGSEYTRTDLIEARVAAEVEAALRKAADQVEKLAVRSLGLTVPHQHYETQRCAAAILALIDQPSALDEMFAQKNLEIAELKSLVKDGIEYTRKQADEIARLREALETIRDKDPISAAHIAHAALEAE
jgi:hypothetical protein